MKLIHHVKKHWKTITLHLKKHHKKYIFWILSATLLRKWVSLIAAYALVHNLSFSFADIVNNGWDNNQQAETAIEQTLVDETPADETPTDETPTDETPVDETPADETPADETPVDGTPVDETPADETPVDGTPIDETPADETPTDETPADETPADETPVDGQNTNNEEELNYWNWFCDAWDILIKSPIAWDITWKTFDITREYTNNDCQNNIYTIKLRDSNWQYLDIFSWNSDTTWFSFDSTQLTWDYFTWHKLAIVSDEPETIYRNQEWNEFTIDNKAPEISNIKIEYSTQKKKLNIWDTITISFESDEELNESKVNILGQYALLEEKNWNEYKYSMDFSENNTSWKIVYWIEFEDIIWNTWYNEWFENIELDYTKPTIDNLTFTWEWNWKVKITFNTNEKTDANLIYQISGTNITKNINITWTDQYQMTLENIKKNYKYNYSIEVQDEAKNAIYVWWDFYISWNEIMFTNKEIVKSELLTDFWFTWNQNNIDVLSNNFGKCAESIRTKDLKISINKYKSVTVKIPNYKDTNVNKLTNAFIAVLFERVEDKGLPQYALNEITEDLNNFLIVVKLVKDDNNECKQNMTEYYINRFKKTLINYWIVSKEK